MEQKETGNYGDNQGNLGTLREESVLARCDLGKEPRSGPCPDCSRNCRHLTTQRIEEHLAGHQGAFSLRLDLTQKLQKQEEKHEYRFKRQAEHKGKEGDLTC